MPGTTLVAARRRWMICGRVLGRSSRGFSTMNMRPVLGVGLGPPGPTVEFTYSTAGSARMMSATLSCSSDSAGNEMSVAASVDAEMKPVSSAGKKPFGMMM